MTEAADYERQPLLRYYAVDHLAADFADELAEIDRVASRVLYVGCGAGFALVGRPAWRGVDFNTQLPLIWKTHGIDDRAGIADARRLPFDDGSFERTVSCDFLEHVATADLPRVFEELNRVAAAGTHIIDSTPQSGFRGVDEKNLHPSGGLQPSEWLRLVDRLDSIDVEIRGRYTILRWG